METSKLIAIIGGIVVVAGVLDLKCKGAAYKMLPQAVKKPVDRIFHQSTK